ncbi:MAG: pitrilysin family protein [bacterium]
MKEVHSSPVVSVSLWLKKGSADEGKYLGSGISHFIEHLLFKGTKERTTTQIANTIREVGGDLNGFTSHNYTGYSISLPKAYYERAIDILADILINPTFEPQELEKEREVILKEINMNLDDHERYLSQLLWSTAYSLHPYQYPIIGLKENFEKLTREDLIKHYQDTYLPSNLALVLTGDIKTNQAFDKVKRYFSNLKPSLSLPPYLPEEPRQLGLKTIEEEREVSKVYLMMGYHGPSIQSDDLYALDLLSSILSEGSSSLFNKILREEKQVVYDVSTFSWTPNHPGLFGIKATLEIKNKEKAIQEILSIIEELKTKGVLEDELKKGKKKILASQIFSKETMEGIAQELALNELFTGNVEFNLKYIEEINKVTNEDIQKVVKRYLNKDNLTLALITPKGSKVGKEDHLRSSFPNKITKRVLSNGITLLLQENKANPVVCLNAMFLGGVRLENKENNGLCHLTNSLILKGTTHKSAQEISKKIELAGGRIETYSVNNYFGCQVNILKEDLDLGLEILSEVICYPIFLEEEISKEKKASLSLILSQQDSLFEAGKKMIREALWKKHPYRFYYAGSKESVENIKQKDIIDFHKKYFCASNMILSISGEVNEEEVVRKTEKAFAPLNLSEKIKIITPKEEPQKEFCKLVESRDQEQTLILFGYHIVPMNHPDMLIFEVLSSILNGQGSRLFYELRDKKGLAYYLGTFSFIGNDPGAYVFYIGTTEDKVDEAISGIFKEIERLKEEDVMEEELNKAKKDIIASKILGLQSNEAKAMEMASNEVLGLGYDYSKKIEELVNKVSQDDLRKIALKYFEKNNLSLVIIKPKSKK